MVVVSEYLQRLTVLRNDPVAVIADDLAHTVRRQQPDFAVWQLLDHDLRTHSEPSRVEITWERNNIAVAHPAHPIQLHDVSIYEYIRSVNRPGRLRPAPPSRRATRGIRRRGRARRVRP